MYLKQIKKSKFFEALQVFDFKDKQKILIIISIQLFLAIFDLVAVALSGILGGLLVSGTSSEKIGNRVQKVISILDLSDKSSQYQTGFIASLILVIFTSKILLSMYLNWRILYYINTRTAKVSTELISKVLSQSLHSINNRSLQENIYLISNAAGFITAVVGVYSVLIVDIFLCAILIVGLCYVDIYLSILITVIFIILLYILYYKFKEKVYIFGQVRTETNVKANELIFDSIQGFREIQVSGRLGNIIDQIGKLMLKSGKNEAKIGFIPMVNKYVIEVTMYWVIFLLAALKFSMSSASNSTAVLSIFVVAVTRIVPALIRIQQGMITLKGVSGYSNSSLVLVKDLQKLKIPNYKLAKFKNSQDELIPEVHLENVEFVYNNSDFKIRIPNLMIQEGDWVSIVGKSGSGKSTLVDLILGISSPQRGTIRLGGFNPREAVGRYPGAIAYVPQVPHIIKGSIKDNLIFGFSANEVPDEILLEAIQIAQLQGFMESNSLNLDSQLGDQGKLWSGGQRQRLSIARALVTQPKLLILDEVTSSLDTTTEFEVITNLQKLKKGTTVILIAHRFTTIKLSPKIAYMKDGEILSVSNFENLRKINSDFNNEAILSGY